MRLIKLSNLIKLFLIALILLKPFLVSANVIFETDFSSDLGYYDSDSSLWDVSNVPTGWDAVRTIQGSVIEVINVPAIQPDKPILKLTWSNVSQPTISLAKHLTGNMSTGYSDLYLRYHVRFPDNFKASNDGSNIPYWKWGRLWQNTNTYSDGTWTENRADSFYTVWNFGGNIPYTMTNVTWGANTGDNLELGSAGGERYKARYFVSGSTPETAPGYFESMGYDLYGTSDWDLYSVADNAELAGFFKNIPQKWHTVEYHFKLATSDTANNGVQELWFDGVSQGAPSEILEEGGAPAKPGIPTSQHGSGWNFFVCFDNMAGWNESWSNSGVEGFIYVDDVVVSTDYIAADYTVGDNLTDSIAPESPIGLLIW